MLRQFNEASGTFVAPRYFAHHPTIYHPLIENEGRSHVYLHYVSTEQWDSMFYKFETEDAAQDVNEYKLLNKICHEQDPCMQIYDDLQKQYVNENMMYI